MKKIIFSIASLIFFSINSAVLSETAKAEKEPVVVVDDANGTIQINTTAEDFSSKSLLEGIQKAGESGTYHNSNKEKNKELKEKNNEKKVVTKSKEEAEKSKKMKKKEASSKKETKKKKMPKEKNSNNLKIKIYVFHVLIKSISLNTSLNIQKYLKVYFLYCLL